MITVLPAFGGGAAIYWKTGNKILFASVLFTWAYLMIPVPVVMRLKSLTALESAYWGIQTLSTVGYGDIKMNSDSLKIFVSFYSMIGMMVAFLWKKLLFEYAYNASTARQIRITDVLKPCGVLLFIVLVNAFYWGPRFNELKSKGQWFINGIYFTVNTISTIGYGDMTPVGPTDCVVFGITVGLGIPAYFFFLGKCVAFIMDKFFQEASRVSRMHTRTMSRTMSTISQDGTLPGMPTKTKSKAELKAEWEETYGKVPDNLNELAGQLKAQERQSRIQSFKESKEDVNEEEEPRQSQFSAPAEVDPNAPKSALGKKGKAKKGKKQEQAVELQWGELQKKWEKLLERASKGGPWTGDKVDYQDWQGCQIRTMFDDGSVLIEICGIGTERIWPEQFQWKFDGQGYENAEFPDMGAPLQQQDVAVAVAV